MTGGRSHCAPFARLQKDSLQHGTRTIGPRCTSGWRRAARHMAAWHSDLQIVELCYSCAILSWRDPRNRRIVKVQWAD